MEKVEAGSSHQQAGEDLKEQKSRYSFVKQLDFGICLPEWFA